MPLSELKKRAEKNVIFARKAKPKPKKAVTKKAVAKPKPKPAPKPKFSGYGTF